MKPSKYGTTKLKDADSAESEELKRRLDELRVSAARAFQSRKRFWFYVELQAAYAVYIDWKSEGNAKKNAKMAATLFGVKRLIGDHPLLTIVKILTPDGVDTRRWVAGLRAAYRNGIAPKKLVAFLTENGGIAGCARLPR